MPASLWYVSEECVTSVWNIRMDLEENMEKVLHFRNGTFYFRAYIGMQTNVCLILLEPSLLFAGSPLRFHPCFISWFLHTLDY